MSKSLQTPPDYSDLLADIKTRVAPLRCGADLGILNEGTNPLPNPPL